MTHLISGPAAALVPIHARCLSRHAARPRHMTSLFQGGTKEGLRRRDSAGTRCWRHPISARASYQPFSFNESDYYEAALQLVQGTLEGGAQGFLLVMRTNGTTGALEDEERGLVLAVGGDTMRSISLLTQRGPSDRPLALDLLWQILERGREISKRDWQLLRVAIVELRGSVFIGRLFFGDPATGKVVWDCDSRPSDSIWLALKSKCPLFVHKAVWEENAAPLRDLRGDAATDAFQEGQGEGEGSEPGSSARRRWRQQSTPGRGSRAGPPGGQAEGEGAGGADSPSALMTRIRPTDPEVLKRLKMEMKVALKEEDYSAAARIRDHPFMRMHLRIMEYQQAGRQSEASDLEARLHDAVERYERSGGTDLQDFVEEGEGGSRWEGGPKGGPEERNGGQ